MDYAIFLLKKARDERIERLKGWSEIDLIEHKDEHDCLHKELKQLNRSIEILEKHKKAKK
jgi:hypothetical protein